MTLARTEGRIAVRLAFVRKCSHQRGRERGGYGSLWYGSQAYRNRTAGCCWPPQPGGHHTSQSLGTPASAAAALVAQLAAPAAVHPDRNTWIVEFQHVYKMPATEVWEQHWVGDVESTWVHASNHKQRSTPSIQAKQAAGTEPEYHHPVRRQPDCVYSPFQESDSAPDAAGWVVKAR